MQIRFNNFLVIFVLMFAFQASATTGEDEAEAYQERVKNEQRVECGVMNPETETLSENVIDRYEECRSRVENKVRAEYAAQRQKAREVEKAEEQAQANSMKSPDSFGKQCVDDTKEATDTCNFSKNKEAQMALMMANQMRGQVKAMSMSSPAMMCSKMGDISQSIDAAVAAFSAYCSTSYGSCDSSCEADIAEIKRAIKLAEANPSPASKQYAKDLELRQDVLEKADRQCSKLSSNVQNVMGNIGSYAAFEAAKSQYCGEKTDALAELCKSQPSNALCAKTASTDCKNPSVAASNLTCICQANRNDPRCTALSKAGLSSGFNNTNASAGSGVNEAEKLGDFGGAGGDGFGGGEPTNFAGNNSEGGGPPGQKAGGRGGGLDVGGGQNPTRPGASGQAASQDGLNTKILSGYGVGGSGGSAGRVGGGYGSGSGGPNAQYGNRGYIAGTTKGGVPPVDLRKFLPGGKMDPSRGLAGMSGPDGITGPNTDIWKKVNGRYYSLQPSLLP